MDLTKDMFKSDIDVDTLLVSAKLLHSHLGNCGISAGGADISCESCPFHFKNRRIRGYMYTTCLVSDTAGTPYIMRSTFRDAALDLDRKSVV